MSSTTDSFSPLIYGFSLHLYAFVSRVNQDLTSYNPNCTAGIVGGGECWMACPWLSACYHALPLSMLINPNQRAVSVTPRSARDAPTGLILF